MQTYSISYLIVFLVICLAAGGLGGLATAKAVREWYPGIKKPSWTPPSWLFGPVWTLLYIMMAVAGWLVWSKAGFGVALILFAAQLALNTIWSFLFFGMKKPGVAAIEIVMLWDAIAATIVFFWMVDPRAGLLMVPYLIWVSFATALNFRIWTLNR